MPVAGLPNHGGGVVIGDVVGIAAAAVAGSQQVKGKQQFNENLTLVLSIPTDTVAAAGRDRRIGVALEVAIYLVVPEGHSVRSLLDLNVSMDGAVGNLDATGVLFKLNVSNDQASQDCQQNNQRYHEACCSRDIQCSLFLPAETWSKLV